MGAERGIWVMTLALTGRGSWKRVNRSHYEWRETAASWRVTSLGGGKNLYEAHCLTSNVKMAACADS